MLLNSYLKYLKSQIIKWNHRPLFHKNTKQGELLTKLSLNLMQQIALNEQIE